MIEWSEQLKSLTFKTTYLMVNYMYDADPLLPEGEEGPVSSSEEMDN